MELLLPIYNGLESENEDIFYTLLRSLANNNNFIFRVKKSRTKLDEIIVSMNGNEGKGKADGYILSNSNLDFLIGIVELESKGNVEKGISQNNIYINSIILKWDELFKDNKYFINFVYDGKILFLEKVFKDTRESIYDRVEVNINNQKEITKKILFEINELNNANSQIKQLSEKSIVKEFKKMVRGKEDLQKYRSELMTVLSSIYDLTKINELDNAIEELKSDSTSISKKIYKSWINIENKIHYKKYKKLINEIYLKIAIPMHGIVSEKNMDLYGYFYEELAEKENKKLQGEYYTPRHIIRPIMKSLYNNFLKCYGWDKEKLSNYIVSDPFCGSGGFLYEYLRMMHKKFNLKEEEINKIASKSLYGFDVIDTSSARLNMYLVGDGNVNLSQVTTSIGWRHRYINEAYKNGNITSAAIKDSLKVNLETISKFLKVYLTEQQLDVLKSKQILDEELYLTKKAINSLSEVNDNTPKYHDLDVFLEELLLSEDDKYGVFNKFGNIDFLMTNVPYGTMREEEAEINGHKDLKTPRYETNALKDCIDLLKHEKIDGTGKVIENGGIATIIVPSGILETKENLTIRQYMIRNCDLLAVIKLPKYTFAPYTTQQTYIIVIKKKSLAEIENLVDENDLIAKEYKNVFLYIADRDGKAASEKRYELGKMEKGKFGLEYIHDDFSENYGKFDGVYKSKIERCWNLTFWKSNKVYNQRRVTEEWDGKKWVEMKGQKWGFYDIITEERELFKVKKIIKDILKEVDKYCKYKKISKEKFFDDLKEDRIDLDLKITKGKQTNIVLSKSIDFLEKYKFEIFFEDGEWKYIDKECYIDLECRPENYLVLKDDSNVYTSLTINENLPTIINEYYVWEIFSVYGEDSKITEDYMYENIGLYPVYSGQTANEGIIGYIKEYQYDGKYLTWTTYGNNAGTVFFREGKFNIGRNCAGLKLRKEFYGKIDMKDIKDILELEIKNRLNSADTRGSASIGSVLGIKLKIKDNIKED